MATVDVAVVGGGLAGLWVADLLAREAGVAVFDAGPEVDGPDHAIVARGLADSPARLARGLGEGVSEELWRWTDRAVSATFELAERLGVFHRADGVWRLFLDDVELSEWRESVSLLARWTGQPFDLAADLPGRGFAGGVLVPGDGQVDQGALRAALRRELSARGVQVRQGAPAQLVSADGGPAVLDVSGERVEAELVILAGGWATASAWAWFDTLLYPVRLQRRVGAGGGDPGLPALCRNRHEAWLSRADGGVELQGCRWAEPPELGAGETEPLVTDAVARAQDQFVARHLGPSEPRERQAGITAWSCDGLPLVGAVPGAGRVQCLVGWNGWGLSHLGAAVQEVAAAVLGRAGQGVPDLLSPRRMV